MNNNKFQQSIISIILCFFMLFSNIVSTFAYEWDLIVPHIVNNESDVIINSSNDLNDNQVIINGNNDISILTNNSNNINTITNNNITKDTVEQNILTENGRIVKAKIEPVYKNLTRANKQIFTLVGRDVIGNLEYGRVEAKDHMIKLICQTFNVNEEWLRNGTEPIFKEDNKKKSLIELLEEEYSLNPLSKKIIETYLNLDKKEQLMFENFAKKLFEENNVS